MKIVYVSRVERAKGLDTLLELSELLRKEKLTDKVLIDFYGQKRDEYFDRYLSRIAEYRYKGVLQPDEVIPCLRKYDVLIFPTHYDGEGCPGILIEALIAGLPVIASDWKYNSEFVGQGVNGLLCRPDDASSFLQAIRRLLEDEDLLLEMSRASKELCAGFSAAHAAELLTSSIG